MALSKAFVAAHIRRCEDVLKNPSAPYRARWPSRLFHHSPLENVIGILRSGVLRSRNDPENVRAFDVAARGIIDTSEIAHEYVRLYFRPNTPTQYHIEGIRRANECALGDNAHAPVLVMLLLRSAEILVRPDIRFSDRNMQKGDALHGDDESFFASIPFEHVFHEGAAGWTSEINARRCAEVMAPSPLPLDTALEAICCRSVAERDTLLYLLGDARGRWIDHVLISDDLRVFGRRFAFMRDVTMSRSGLSLSINPRHDGGTFSLKVVVRDMTGSETMTRAWPEVPSVPPRGDRWGVGHDFADGRYEVAVEIEHRIAYRNLLTVGDVIF